jgi:hypothetical protein
LLTALGALVLLVASAISVCAKASRWLKPLPLRSVLLAQRTLIPVLTALFCVSAIESWLIWVLGWSVARSIAIGVLTLAASAIFAVAGGVFAIHTSIQRNNGRL